MKLEIQITTFIFSLLFGFYFSLILNLFKKIILKNKLLQIIVSFIIIFINAIIYFIVSLKLNNAILHPYYLFGFIIGFFLENVIFYLFKRIVKKKKKWYNSFGG